MAGNKNSGRRTKYEEVHVNELAGMSVRWGIENWDKLPDDEKMRVLLSLGPRYVVQKVEGEGFEFNIHNLINQIQRDFQESGLSSMVFLSFTCGRTELMADYQ